jgi:hypothetical protein
MVMTPSKPTLPWSLIPLALGLGLGACVDDGADSGLTVLKAVPAEAGCTFTAGGDLFRPAGVIQTDTNVGYLLGLEVRNDISLAEGESPTPKTVFITGATVEVGFFGSSELFSSDEQATLRASGLTRFLVPISGPVEPNSATSVFPFTAVPLDLIDAVRDKMIASEIDDAVVDLAVQFKGTRGGSSISSNVFHYPVEICTHCVVSFLGRCTDLSSSGNFGTGGACNPVQDGHLDCCTGIDPDDLEVPCNGEPPPAGFVCDDAMDEPAPMVCPAHSISM